MERSKRDLEALVVSQKEQLTRYEKRLKDVVTAYKGLLKEKEALETSLAALTLSSKDNSQSSTPPPTRQPSTPTNDDNDGNETNVKQIGHDSTTSIDCVANEDKNQLQTQIITLMNSLATLSAEKSRMEASFQADKKQLRAQLAQKGQSILNLQDTIKENEQRAKAHLEEMKAKWIIECQEREKETNNQMLMIRELQKLYADERHLKENIEMQLNNFKTQFASNEAENTRTYELQNQLKEAKAQLKELQAANSKQITDLSDSEPTNSVVLHQVQQEMQQLKEQHAIAIKNEQKRVLHAEEQSRRQAALHEDRVANLEARLAELSSTVGNYDRLRQQDQESIQMLRKKLQDLEFNNDSVVIKDIEVEQRANKESSSTHNVIALVDEIVQLKKQLMIENSRIANPIDVSKVFAIGADHLQCQEELNHVEHQHEACKAELAQAQEGLEVQKSHIFTLQEKVKVLNRNIDEQELELKQLSEKSRQAVKEERNKWKNALAEMENENRCKIMDLEQQLQKQRQRSLQLLEEKEQEIKTLHTSFEVFHNATMSRSVSESNAEQNAATSASDVESNDGTGANSNTTGIGNNMKKSAIRAKKLSIGENCHMLHYANEIARKDIEITGLRKAKYSAESSLRKAIQEKVTAQEELCDRIATLEEEVDRLERCKTREGANLEYLKNVIISFIVTRDAEGKRHMLNAISAVLQFTPIEIQTINAAFHKK